MRLAKTWPRRVAQHVARSSRHSGLCGRLGVASLALGAVMPCAVVQGVTMSSAVPAAMVLTGVPVPADQLVAIKSAAASCPELNPPRLAAQVMAASRFNPQARTAGGGLGVASLTASQWRQWIPGPGIKRTDVAANILALAHDDCDLAGRVRVAGVAGDPWRLAMAAFRVGVPAVTAARGIPADAADYVSTVAAYAAWYARLPQFGGKGVAAKSTHRPKPTDKLAFQFAGASELSCSDLGTIRSPGSYSEVTFTFINKSTKTLRIIWITFSGSREIYNTLPPGTSYRQGTYINHVWLIANSAGSCLGIFRVNSAGRLVISS